jgi:hypothetical protein
MTMGYIIVADCQKADIDFEVINFIRMCVMCCVYCW